MFNVIKLPYSLNALEPYISYDNLFYHYEKHHKGYANKLNDLAKQFPRLNNMSLDDIINNETGTIYNMAAQLVIHNFYWLCMSPKSHVSNYMNNFFNEYFDGIDNFKKKFKESFISGFGSGWTWLIYNQNDNLFEIVNTHDAEIPNGIPLLVCDYWEHAYYLTTRNDRSKFIDNWWNIVNWDFVENNIKSLYLI